MDGCAECGGGACARGSDGGLQLHWAGPDLGDLSSGDDWQGEGGLGIGGAAVDGEAGAHGWAGLGVGEQGVGDAGQFGDSGGAVVHFAFVQGYEGAGDARGCIEQIYRLLAERLAPGVDPQLDGAGRVRLDDWEMREEVQGAVAKLWPEVATENLGALSDIKGYQEEFLRLFGFGLAGVDYEAESDPVVSMPSAAH